MTKRTFQFVLAAATILVLSTAYAGDDSQWQKEFGISDCNLLTTGRNVYFILEPGYQLVLEKGGEKVEITVLDETQAVGGVITRVVEEREWEGGQLYEISRNYFAMCEQTKDVFYYGEDVDYYRDGEVVGHEGAWLVGQNHSSAGLIMPGTPRVGMKYYQEVSPGVAMDRAEIISLDETCKTPVGTFSNCMKVKESNPIEGEEEYKYHAPGIGLIQDEDLVLTKHGFVKDEE